MVAALSKKRKPPRPPRARIVSALRILWLHSPERRAAIKRSGMKCECCEKRLFRTRKEGDVPEVHHVDGVSWTMIIELIIDQLLVPADRLLVLCKSCHHAADKKIRNDLKRQGELKL